ncbi:entericidin A/B family lipoprotein [Cognaticolwellia beringensis]|uniref:Entericidin, EcnA/B family n=1 Tax=Cognaticolwellia beringensis TaxID=1967665 RepID=A0A222G7C8_9GAMM|nr:entericidin A/B family lipoprotein [Cognaticolwellia beringensis]ASP47769.1 entericidin, EcnA/B family [Cognaticolwellia beringensis]
MKAKTYYANIKSIITVLLLSIALGACATIEGAGKDIESAGEAVQDAADG